jgi:hypothetical protein
VTGLWTMIVMPDGVLVPPLPRSLITFVQSIGQWRKETDVEMK